MRRREMKICQRCREITGLARKQKSKTSLIAATGTHTPFRGHSPKATSQLHGHLRRKARLKMPPEITTGFHYSPLFRPERYIFLPRMRPHSEVCSACNEQIVFLTAGSLGQPQTSYLTPEDNYCNLKERTHLHVRTYGSMKQIWE